VKNNIFILSWPSPALSACATLGLDPLDSLLMDYNCYFVESLGYIGANERPDYYDWRTWLSFGVEAHGINADPLVFGSDPHLGPGSPCIGAAVPIPGFDYDIDGDPRDPMHPDMGADEYTGPEPESRDNSWPSPRNARPQCAVLRTLPDGLVFNAMGRRVTEPRSGIYFVVSEPSAASSRKIVLTE
jgi:hypothetical protein